LRFDEASGQGRGLMFNPGDRDGGLAARLQAGQGVRRAVVSALRRR